MQIKITSTIFNPKICTADLERSVHKRAVIAV